jgi:hypothetical protein
MCLDVFVTSYFRAENLPTNNLKRRPLAIESSDARISCCIMVQTSTKDYDFIGRSSERVAPTTSPHFIKNSSKITHFEALIAARDVSGRFLGSRSIH